MNPNLAQLIIGFLALLEAVFLLRKLRRTGDLTLWASISAFTLLGVVYLVDAVWQRTSMEPARTISYTTQILLLFVFNINHIARIWRKEE